MVEFLGVTNEKDGSMTLRGSLPSPTRYSAGLMRTSYSMDTVCELCRQNQSRDQASEGFSVTK